MIDAPVAIPSQEGASPPATPGPFDPAGDDKPPADIAANNHDLSVDEHYEIARMRHEEVRRRYVVGNVDGFLARAKAAIKYGDGVEV